MPVPSVENHPQRKEIVERILAGESLRSIAATLNPKVHHASIARFKLEMIAPAVLTLRGKSDKSQAVQNLAAASGLEVQTAPDPAKAKDDLRQFVQERISKRLSRREEWTDKAESDPVFNTLTGIEVGKRMNHRALSAHDKNERDDLEFLSKLGGLLHDGSDAGARVRAVVMMPGPNQQPTVALELELKR